MTLLYPPGTAYNFTVFLDEVEHMNDHDHEHDRDIKYDYKFLYYHPEIERILISHGFLNNVSPNGRTSGIFLTFKGLLVQFLRNKKRLKVKELRMLDNLLHCLAISPFKP